MVERTRDQVQAEPLWKARFSLWCTSLGEAAALATLLDRGVGSDMTTIHTRVTAEEVTVTFGGAYNAGKSSLIDGALQRPLLPVSDFPETGVTCVLRAGKQDIAMVHGDDGPRLIPCTTEGIEKEVSLISSDGEVRSEVERVRRLEVTLSRSPIPPRACWIDPPGVNDDPSMDARALEAIQAADVLIWVTRSSPCLVKTEREILSRYIKDHGSAAVVLVVNAILAKDTDEEWEAFQRQDLPWLLESISGRAAEIGFPHAEFIQVVVVAARALCRNGSRGYGGAELRQLLTAIDSPGQTCVLQSRLSRAASGLQVLGGMVEQKLSEEEDRIDAIRNATDRARVRVEEQSAKFRKATTGIVSQHLSSWATKARECARKIASETTAANLTRGDHYSDAINEALQANSVACAEELVREIQAEAQRCGLSPMSSTVKAELHGHLDLPILTVEVADNPGSWAAVAAGAAAGAVGGTVVPFVGTIAGAVVGAIAAICGEGNAAVEKDAADTRARIKDAVDAALTTSDREKRILELVTRSCAPLAKEETEEPDDTLLLNWNYLSTLIDDLVREAIVLNRELQTP